MNSTPPLDRRLLVGLTITVADLVAVFIDHRPGQAPTCGACRHRYTTTAPLCPSATLARQLLKRRQHEDPESVQPIHKELHSTRDDGDLPPPDPSPAPVDQPGELFALDSAWRKPARRRVA